MKLLIRLLLIHTFVTSAVMVNAQDSCAVLPFPVSMDSVFPQCLNGGDVVLNGSHGYWGTFSGAGVSGNMFTPSVAGVGIHDLVYTYTAYSTDTVRSNYSPIAITGDSIYLGDDWVLGPYNIGFNFDFFGNTYSQFYVSANGFITFNGSSSDGCCSGDVLPNYNFWLSNLIAWAWSDLDPSWGSEGICHYEVLGSAPNRRLVISFDDYHTSENDSVLNAQIHLLETTNQIELHLDHVVYDDEDMTIGILSEDGEVAHVYPGANSASFLSFDDAFVRFTPEQCTHTDTTKVLVENPEESIAFDVIGCLAFDTIQQYTSIRDSVKVYNSGCDTLFISGLSSSLSEYTFESYDDYILPRDTGRIVIEFSTNGIGGFPSTITVNTNFGDGDTTFCVSAYAKASAVISYTPTTVYDSIFACDDSSLTIFKVYNTGIADLHFGLKAYVPMFSENFESGFLSGWIDQGGTYVSKEITTAEAVEGSRSLSLSSNNWDDFDGLIHYFPEGSPDYISFYMMTDSTGPWRWGGNLSVGQDPNWNGDGMFNVGYDGSTPSIHLNYNVYTPVNENQWYFIEIRDVDYVNYTFDFYIDGVLIADNHWFNNWGTNYVNAIAVAASEPGTYDYFDDIFIGHTLPNVLLNPDTGSASTNDTVTVQIKTYSSGLLSGDYHSNLFIESNDPVSSKQIANLYLHIDGTPAMLYSDSCYYLDSIMEFTSNSDTLYIWNAGCDTLFIDSLVTATVHFGVDTSSFWVYPGDSIMVSINFTPQATGTFYDTIFIYSNDYDDTVCLSGKAFYSPQISFNPSLLNATLNSCTDTVIDSVKVYNTGAGELTFSLSNISSGTSMASAFCTPSYLNSCCEMSIWNVSFADINYNSNVDAFPFGYVDNTIIGTNVLPGQTYTMTINVSNYYYTDTKAWIDYNNDGDMLDAGEEVFVSNYKLLTHTAPITIPSNVVEGTRLRMRIHSDYYNENIGNYCDNTYYGQVEDYYVLIGNIDTVLAGDSLTVPVQFVTGSRYSGTHYEYIYVNSNDPLNNVDSIPVTLTINGAPEIALSTDSLNLDTVMQHLTNTAELTIYNTGCDTLFIANSVSTTEFGINITNDTILVGDSTIIYSSFNPLTVGSFLDSIVILNNAIDTVVYLYGISVGAPVYSTSEDTLYSALSACCDSIQDTIWVKNTGLGNLEWSAQVYHIWEDDFNDGIDSSLWIFYDGIGTATMCEPNDGQSLYFYLTYDREIRTKTFDVSNGGYAQYDVWVSDGTDGCYPSGSSDDMYFYYSTNGGTSWTYITQHDRSVTNNWVTYKYILPIAAQTPNTMFRWYQPGDGDYYDYAAIDNVSIVAYQPDYVSVSPLNDTTLVNDSLPLAVRFNSCSISSGNYEGSILITQNDPLTSGIDTIPYFFTLSGAPEVAFIDSCITMDTTIELSTSENVVHIINTGCDTLFISDINNQTAYFDPSDTSVYILPGDTQEVQFYFNPASTGNYTDTFTVISNTTDIDFCVNAYARDRGILSYMPDSFDINLGCNDSIVDSLVFYNTGLGSLHIQMSGYEPMATIACQPNYTYSTCCNMGIDSITFSNLSFNSVIGNYYGYKNYTSQVAQVKRGDTYQLNVYVNPGWSTNVKVWIDYDGNGILNETNELVLNSNNYNLTHTGMVTIPAYTDVSAPIRMRIQSDYYGQTIGNYCDDSYYGSVEDYSVQVAILDTILASGDSVTYYHEFNSLGLTVGDYYDQFYFVSDDPLASYDSIDIDINVFGIPDVAINKTCLTFDSIMEYTLDYDTLVISNLGCDTLFIDSTDFKSNHYSILNSFSYVLPDSTEELIVRYQPTLFGTNDDTLTFFTNDVDTFVCITAKAFPRPIIRTNIDSIIDQLGSCCDSVVHQIEIYNDGGTDLYLGSIRSLYGTFDSVASTNFNGSGDSSSFYFSGVEPSDSLYLRIVINGDFNSAGEYTSLYLDGDYVMIVPDHDIGTATNDTIYINLGGINVQNWTADGIVNVKLVNSPGVGWGYLDLHEVTLFNNVEGPLTNYIEVSTQVDTIAPGDTLLLDIELNACALPNGTYNNFLLLYSNDPLIPKDTVKINLAVDPAPPAPLMSDAYGCFASVIPDLVASGTGISWYSDSLITLVYSGDTFTTGQTAVGNYTYYATQTIGGCEGPVDSVTLYINSSPTKPNVDDVAACFSFSIPDLVYSGVNTKWYSDASLTNLLHTGDTFSTGQTAVGMYTYYLTDSLSGCAAGVSDTVTLDIRGIPSPPASLNDTACFGFTIPDLIATGDSIRWYLDPGLTFLTFSGDTFPTGQTAIGTYNYYVTQTDILAGCQSNYRNTKLIIQGPTGPPTVPNDTACEGGVVPDLVASGIGTIKWYSDQVLNTLVFTGDTFATGETAAGVYTYYITRTVNSCESQADSAKLVINAPIGVPSASDSGICFGNPTPDLTATGTALTWYDDMALSTIVNLGTSFSTGETAVGVYTYYVTQTIGGCESAPDTSILEINAAPSAPTMSDTTICFGNPTPDLITSGSNVRWYGDATLTTLVNTGNTFVTGHTAVGTYRYYVTDSINGCLSQMDSINLVINSGPPIPSVFDSTICQYSTTPTFMVGVGSNIRWYNNTALTNVVGSGNNFTPSSAGVGVQTFYVTDSIVGCPKSTPDTATFEVLFTPDTPSVTNQNICFGQSTPDLTTSSATAQWYNDDALTTLLNVGTTYSTGETAVGTYTYYLVDSSGICGSAVDSVKLMIGAAPSAPVALDTTICFGDPTPNLTAIGSDLKWYSDIALSNLFAVGNTLVSGETGVGIYNYYVTDSFPACPPSVPDTATLTILSVPAKPTANDTAVCFGTTVPDLVATGTNIQWYSNPSLSTLVHSGNTFATGNTAIGVYTYYVTQSNGNCEGLADTVRLTIKAAPSVTAINNVVVCDGDSIQLNASATGVVSYFWSSLMGTISDSSISNPYITSPDTTNFVITVTNTSGCTASDTVVVNVASLPCPLIVNILSTEYAVCQNQCVNITANAVHGITPYTSYVWDNGLTSSAGPHTICLSGDSSINVKVFDSLGDSAIASISILVNAAPTILVSIDDTICDGDMANITASGGVTYSWWPSIGISDTAVSNPDVNPSSDQSYYVQTFDGLGCASDTDSINIKVLNYPSAPTTTDASACGGGSIPSLNALGSNLFWFNNAGLSNLVNTGAVFNTGETASGTYTYYVVDSINRCGFGPSATVSLIISPNTTLPPTVNDTTVCYGDSTPMLLAQGYSLVWYKDVTLLDTVGMGDTLIPGVTKAGTYTYYVTDNSPACPASEPSEVQLTIHPAPLLTVKRSTFTISAGESVELNAFNADTFYWSPLTALDTTFGADVIAAPTTTTIYTVTGINEFGCASMLDVTINVNALGLNQIEWMEELSISPNPSDGIFNITFTSLEKQIDLVLYNTLGEAVYEELLENNSGRFNHRLDIRNLATGWYNLSLVGESGIVNRRIIFGSRIYNTE